MQDNLEQLKRDFHSPDLAVSRKADRALTDWSSEEAFSFFVEALRSPDAAVRSLAALHLESIGDSRAIEPLLHAIFLKDNLNTTGTLVYALNSLDCSKYGVAIFDILFHQSFESKVGAHSIIIDQQFEWKVADLEEIRKMWNCCKANPDKCVGFSDPEIYQLIKDVFDFVNNSGVV